MRFLKLILLLILVTNLCLCQDEKKEEDESKQEENGGKTSVQVVSGKKEKKFDPLIVSGTFYSPYAQFNYPEPGWKASASLVSDAPDEGERGVISFHQWGPNNIIRVAINATGLPPGKHAVHIHEFGDISQGCKSTGSHMQSNFIGNIEIKEDGTVDTSFFAPILNMFGYHGIVGRSVVIHEKPIEVYLQPEVFSSPYHFVPVNAISLQTEESKVGLPVACGSITIKGNQA